LRTHAAPDGTVTLLFTDIEDSTGLTVRLDDQRWPEILRAHHALIRRQVHDHGGFEVKCQGDGFMLAFQRARRGLDCAIAIQRAVVAAAHGSTDSSIELVMNELLSSKSHGHEDPPSGLWSVSSRNLQH
jgi:class 3 adenylate cyclase